ncbi:MAG: hypothetical protein V9G12_26065 [Microthrixaceae bacterium]
MCGVWLDSVPAAGGVLVDPDPAAMGDALVRFFRGELAIEPKREFVPWTDVADAVEAHLMAAISSARRAG